jgi:DNA mismatch endonuclease (patch repair protein)
MARDARNMSALTAMGWEVLTIWECETFDAAALERRLAAYLIG